MNGHTPVLLAECLEGLNIAAGGVYVDGTFGSGGHSAEILKRLGDGRLIAIDRDDEAIKAAGGSLPEHSARVDFVNGNFRDLPEILDGLDVGLADGMLFDLGFSSSQVDESGRGFSYMRDGALDMRMDRREEETAYDAVNAWPEEKLRRVFYEYGEERYAGLIARAISRKRAAAPIRTTFQLNEVIKSAIPAAARREDQHPSKRCYQGLRIAINDELGSIGDMLKDAPYRLKSGGRLCIISFHSLEDRIVKTAFTSLANGCDCPKGFPVCVCGKVPAVRVVTKKPIQPGEEETRRNPRARSAKLRIAERL